MTERLRESDEGEAGPLEKGLSIHEQSAARYNFNQALNPAPHPWVNRWSFDGSKSHHDARPGKAEKVQRDGWPLSSNLKGWVTRTHDGRTPTCDLLLEPPAPNSTPLLSILPLYTHCLSPIPASSQLKSLE